MTAAGSVIGGLVSPAVARRLGMIPSLVIAGAADAASLRQQVVPAHLLGRVSSVYRMLGWA